MTNYSLPEIPDGWAWEVIEPKPGEPWTVALWLWNEQGGAEGHAKIAMDLYGALAVTQRAKSLLATAMARQ